MYDGRTYESRRPMSGYRCSCECRISDIYRLLVLYAYVQYSTPIPRAVLRWARCQTIDRLSDMMMRTDVRLTAELASMWREIYADVLYILYVHNPTRVSINSNYWTEDNFYWTTAGLPNGLSATLPTIPSCVILIQPMKAPTSTGYEPNTSFSVG